MTKNGHSQQSSTRRHRPAFFLAVALAALAGSAYPVRAQDRTAPEVQAVVFEGANSLDPSILRRSIKTKASRCRSPLFFLPCRLGDFSWAEARALLDTAEVAQDKERLATLYEAWGFPDAAAESVITPQNDGDVIVTFRVAEGTPITIRSIQLRTDERTSDLKLPARSPLRTGQPYALPRLAALEALLYTELAQRGYPYAKIEVSGSVNEQTRVADVVLEVNSGGHAVFGSTEVTAQSPISQSVVRRRLAYDPGDPFSLDALERTERNLFALPITQRAVAQVSNAQRRDSVINVEVSVDARPPHGFAGEATISSTDCAELRGYWQHRYALGGPRVFALGVHTSNLLAQQADGDFPCSSSGTGEFAELNYGVEADLRQFLGRSGMVAVRGFAARESAPDVYVQKGYGGELSLSRAFSRTLDGMLSIAPERNRLEAADLYFCGQYGVCTADEIARLAGYHWRSPLEAVLVWNSSTVQGDVRRPDPGPGRDWSPGLIPTQRWNVRAGFAAAGPFSGSDFDYSRGLFELTGTRILSGSIEVAARARTGFVSSSDVLPPQVMLFSGGPNSVRGFAQNLLGPKVLATRVRPANCAPCSTATFVDPDDVTLRPTGGHQVYEGSVEARIWLGSRLQVAAFVDAGRLRRNAFADIPEASETALTPGIGMRVMTDVGPIRLDLGYDASGVRRYPLFLQENGELLPLGTVSYDPFGFDRPGPFKEIFRRLQLHMSVGQAF